MDEFTRSRHTVGGANFHLQFTPKYRRRVFEDETIREACREAFHAKAKALGVVLEACEFGPDHVHIFVCGCKNYSVPQLAQHFKGFSARVLRRDKWHRVRKYEWGGSFWSDGYFHESVGRVTSETVRYYIERQKKKHWICGDAARPKKRGQTRLSDFAS